jgi:hypothetical protein
LIMSDEEEGWFRSHCKQAACKVLTEKRGVAKVDAEKFVKAHVKWHVENIVLEGPEDVRTVDLKVRAGVQPGLEAMLRMTSAVFRHFNPVALVSTALRKCLQQSSSNRSVLPCSGADRAPNAEPLKRAGIHDS